MTPDIHRLKMCHVNFCPTYILSFFGKGEHLHLLEGKMSLSMHEQQ